MSLWNSSLHVEFVAQLDLDSPVAHKGTDNLNADIGEAQVCPLPQCAPEYVGWVQHPDFGGRMSMRLRVKRMEGRWGGAWQLGGRRGPRGRVEVDFAGDRLRIRSVLIGRRCLDLDGEVGSSSKFFGEVLEVGRHVGDFDMWPVRVWNVARRWQEWCVAFRCVDMPSHHPELELPPECCVCLVGFTPGDVITRTSCSSMGHVFHRCCIDEWLGSNLTCPLCRRLLRGFSEFSEDDYDVLRF